ncbi:MAG: DUF2510 domain-containing protein [Actinomycetota bacterium]
MSDVPAGWYDDPEDSSQYRYWDGSRWTDNRSPRTTAQTGPSGTDVGGGALSDGWNLFRRNWLAFLAISAASLVLFIVVAAVGFVAINDATDPTLVDIIDRVTDEDFDPVDDPADEAYVEAIEFTPGAGFWVLVPVLLILVAVLQAFIIGTGAVHVAADHVGRPRALSESLGVAFRRLPRWIGVYLLWFLGYIAASIALTIVVVLLAVISGGLLLLLAIPGVFALVIWLYPTLFMMPTALAVGPTDEPPFRTTFAMMRAGWRQMAWPVLLVNLVLIAISIGLGVLGVIPVLGVLVSLVGNFGIYAYSTCVNVALWTRLGGRIGVDIGGGAAPVS